ncbi:hypothetical protein [Prosthecobacter sp.]|uniref:hypothetical protein n=1 Tax=Prosthecobacter sp. TaxID=1965333 RepID=UPI0037847D34
MSTKEEWAEGLRQHVKKRFQDDPIPERKSLTSMQEMQCRILGGHLLGWLDNWGPSLIQERNVYAGLRAPSEPVQDKEPVILFIMDDPGLVAARQIIRDTSGRLIYARPDHVREYTEAFPDEDYLFHCVLESWFEKEVGHPDKELCEKYHLDPQVKIGTHHDCSIMGPLFARGALHLWSFTDDDFTMVEEAYQTWVS